MAATLKVSIFGARIAAAVALDCAWYIDENLGTTNKDIAQILGIGESQLSDAKRGFYQLKAEQAVILARFGMTRTLAEINMIADELRRNCSGEIAYTRALELFRSASAATDKVLTALNDKKLTKDEKTTCEAALLDLLHVTQMMLSVIRGMEVHS